MPRDKNRLIQFLVRFFFILNMARKTIYDMKSHAELNKTTFISVKTGFSPDLFNLLRNCPEKIRVNNPETSNKAAETINKIK